MVVSLIGTGEAFNSNLCNSSVFIEDKLNILIDCGFTVPYFFWKKFNNPNIIDLIYFTHYHADHFFGTAALITRMIEENRNKNLIVIGQTNIKETFENLINLAYPNILAKKTFNIDFYSLGNDLTFNNIKFSFAKTHHSVPNYAICVQSGSSSISISGDGAPTTELIDLYKIKQPNTIIQECFTLSKNSKAHTSYEEILEFEKTLDYKPEIYLIHISRKEINDFKNLKFKVLTDGDVLEI